MPKKVIFSTSLQEFRPVIWYSEPIYTKYGILRKAIAEKLGEKYAELLAEPLITTEAELGKSKAHWLSDYLPQPVAFPQLNPAQQETARVSLSLMIAKIKSFAGELKSSDDKNQRDLGELLELAVEVPGMEYVFAQDDKVVLTLWGFTSEIAQKTDFRITKAIEKPAIPDIPVVVPVVEQIPVKEESKNVTNVTPPANRIQQNPVVPPIKNMPPETKSSSGKKGILWFILGAILMFLILFLIWWFFLRNPSAAKNILPPKADILPPIDTTHTGTDPNDPSKRVIFTDKFNAALKKGENIKKFAQKVSDKYSKNLKIVYYDTVINLVQFQTEPNLWKQWSDTVKKMSEVRLVFSEAMFQKSEIPKDPVFSDAEKSWYFDKIQAYAAWDITKGSDKVVVAIIDNGFDATHPEFAGKIVNPWNVFTHSADIHPVGGEGGMHGTHVACTAVGLMNNGQGLCGIAPNCKLMPIQVADDNGNLTSLSIISGILYAINKNADVVNMSLGMKFPNQIKNLSEEEQKKLTETMNVDEAVFWNELYKFALENKIVFVQAAGNDDVLAGIDPSARSKNTIVVSAVGTKIEKAEFSNFGQTATISAPGVNIYSAFPGGKFGELQGTSMASPIVTGAAALMKSLHPNYTAEQIIKILVKTAKPLNSQKYIGPLLQIADALKADTSQTKLVIPKNPKDLAFAEGRWKSSNNLLSTIDQSQVSLYFDINKSGKGTLTLVEEKKDGSTCKSDLTITFKDGKLIMQQNGNSECADGKKFYKPYNFECVQGKDNSADCKASEKNNNSKVIDFQLYKQN
jgi:subtilisin family serine protease